MSEFHRELSQPESCGAEHIELTLEQVVHDLEEHAANQEKYGPDGIWDFGPEFDGMRPFADIYGYPDPRYGTVDRYKPEISASEPNQSPVEPTVMQMALDVYYYKCQVTSAARQGQLAPSFYEVYGYPDPREDSSQDPSSAADDSA